MNTQWSLQQGIRKEHHLFHRCWWKTWYKKDSVLGWGLQTLFPEQINANTHIHLQQAEPSTAAGHHPVWHAEPTATSPPAKQGQAFVFVQNPHPKSPFSDSCLPTCKASPLQDFILFFFKGTLVFTWCLQVTAALSYLFRTGLEELFVRSYCQPGGTGSPFQLGKSCTEVWSLT